MTNCLVGCVSNVSCFYCNRSSIVISLALCNKLLNIFTNSHQSLNRCRSSKWNLFFKFSKITFFVINIFMFFNENDWNISLVNQQFLHSIQYPSRCFSFRNSAYKINGNWFSIFNKDFIKLCAIHNEGKIFLLRKFCYIQYQIC